MTYNFDTIVQRRHTDSIKYDFAARSGKPEGILPLWVADMDFPAPPCVEAALSERVRHGIYGYSDTGERYFKAVAGWLAGRHGYTVKPEWLVKTPGVVFALATAIRAFTLKGDAVLIQQPVYNPFASCIQGNNRRLAVNRLLYKDGRYAIDFDDFERQITSNSVKLFILCNPHNPVGRVWSAQELERMGDICLRHGVTVVSDEIHMDFVYTGHKHIPFASLKPSFEEITVTCTAPSKTFNLAGLENANIFIADRAMRERFAAAMGRAGSGVPNVMGLISCEAAYRGGALWLDSLLEYLTGNIKLVRNTLADRLPRARLAEPEGTYLLWMDFSDYGLDSAVLNDIITHKAGVWLNDGAMFGVGGEGFQRMNIACPRSVLADALERITGAFQAIT